MQIPPKHALLTAFVSIRRAPPGTMSFFLLDDISARVRCLPRTAVLGQAVRWVVQHEIAGRDRWAAVAPAGGADGIDARQESGRHCHPRRQPQPTSTSCASLPAATERLRGPVLI